MNEIPSLELLPENWDRALAIVAHPGRQGVWRKAPGSRALTS
ncbi:MAG: hypothetical protein R2709_00350 [Marmoricola sp.]